MEMGYREYARHKGVTLGAVQKAIKTGRIQVTADKKIDSQAADLAWESNTDASRVAVNVLNNQPQPVQHSIQLALPTAADTTAGADRADGEEVKGTDRIANEYREHRATRERYQALTHQLEYEQLVGTLIKVDEAKRIAFTSFRGMRDAVMNVAPRIKDQLAAISDPHEVEQILERELSAALGGVDVGKLLKDSDQDD
jgi:hypothetical protein